MRISICFISSETGVNVTRTKIPRRLLKYSDDETPQQAQDRENLQTARRAYHARMSKFTREFRDILTGEQMTATEKLSNAIDVLHRSGNAVASYDGVSITSVTYGPKDGVTDHIMHAMDLIRRCRTALNGVLMPYDLYSVLEIALINDYTPQELGDVVAKKYRLKAGRDKRRGIAVNLIETAAQRIVPVFSSRSKYVD